MQQFWKKMQTHSFKRHQVSCPPTINKFGKDSREPLENMLKFYWFVISTKNSDHNSDSDLTNLFYVSFAIFNGKFFTLNTLERDITFYLT